MHKATSRLQRDQLIAILAIALMMAGVACSPGQAGGTPFPTRIELPAGREPLPDHEPCRGSGPEPCVEAGRAVFGTLHEADGCVWYVLDNGTEARVVWPFGYSASYDPFIVYDNSGREVARDGDALEAAGSGPQEGDADACGRTQYVVLIDPIRRATASADSD